MRNLPRSAAPVAPYLVRYRIQHSSCLSPCGILNRISSLPSSVQLLCCQLAFPCCVRLVDYPLVFSIHRFGMSQFVHHRLLELSDCLCSYPFGLWHLLTAYRHPIDGGCFRAMASHP